MRVKSGGKRAGESAFTLVEISAAMAVVVVLASVLFPVFSSASGRKVGSCLSNGIQFRQACMLYSQDYDEKTMLPPKQLSAYMEPGGFQLCPVGEQSRSYLLTRYESAHRMHALASNDLTYHGGPVMTNGSQ